LQNSILNGGYIFKKKLGNSNTTTTDEKIEVILIYEVLLKSLYYTRK